MDLLYRNGGSEGRRLKDSSIIETEEQQYH